ncbi:MAG: hypothetical protein IIY28_10380, partial [Lachnospiraceae bacterium]|nr:hypothetical protein [Lachnospiraceae bacterium]
TGEFYRRCSNTGFYDESGSTVGNAAEFEMTVRHVWQYCQEEKQAGEDSTLWEIVLSRGEASLKRQYSLGNSTVERRSKLEKTVHSEK